MMLWSVLLVLGGVFALLVLLERDERRRTPPPPQRCSCLPAMGYVCTATRHHGEFDAVDNERGP